MSIEFDGEGFGSAARKVPWRDVVAVGIRTSADGPFGEDVFWQFLLRDGLVELPGSWIDGAALEVMQRELGGLDSFKIVRAMGSTDERIFRVWHVDESRRRWDDAALAARFVALIARLGGAASRAGEVFLRLDQAWRDDARRYHDREHLTDCLGELDLATAETHAAPELADVAELALWYHDAIYEPLRRDNEARSAELLLGDAAELAIPHARAEAAANSVRATAHQGGDAPHAPAADLVIDIDLAILGRDGLRFMDFEYGVGEEYAAVSRLGFIVGRGHFLASLLAAPAIFRTAHFRDRYEARARANLSALLRSPRYRSYRWLGRFCRRSA